MRIALATLTAASWALAHGHGSIMAAPKSAAAAARTRMDL
jgi:hypothetical protein